jgi:hypothetical protein
LDFISNNFYFSVTTISILINKQLWEKVISNPVREKSTEALLGPADQGKIEMWRPEKPNLEWPRNKVPKHRNAVFFAFGVMVIYSKCVSRFALEPPN